MRSSAEEALSLLNKWLEEKSWVLVNGHFVNKDEQHKFWAVLGKVSSDMLFLSGEFAALQVPLNSVEFEFADLREAPEPIRMSYGNFESCLAIKSDGFTVTLMRSPSGMPVSILPPDIIPPEKE